MNRLVITGLNSSNGFRLAGELDMSTSGQLADVLDPALDRGGDITLDLADLAFMDSTGLQILIRSAIQLGDSGRLVLRSPGNLVRSILDLALHTDKIRNLVIEGGEEPAS